MTDTSNGDNAALIRNAESLFRPAEGDIVQRLRDTPNWRKESFGSWKDCVSTYDRAPFEAADEIERLRALATQPPQDEREAIVSKTISNTEPRLVESFPIEVKIDPNANKGTIKIAAQPVALSTLTAEQILSRWDAYVGEPTPERPLTDADKLAFARAILAASAPAQQAGQARAYVSGDEAHRELRWMPDMPSFDLPVGTKLYVATTPQPVAAEVARLLEMQEKYQELIFAVARKFPGESRHETALRYINRTESNASSEPSAALSGTGSDENNKG